jgi:hypothetical protein
MAVSQVLLRSRWRAVAAVVFALLVWALVLAGSAVPSVAAGPETVGAFTGPFEEGGTDAPRCTRDENGFITCIPVASSSVALRDGSVLYWNGIEASENTDYGQLPELADASRDSRARVLDLTGRQVTWTDASTGEASNPNIGDKNNNAFGTAGVPGRPGDGLVGSTVGQVAPQNPTNPPDDKEDNDGDMFCSYQVQLSDGKVIVFGGTDWYSEPDGGDLGTNEPEIDDRGGLELEGLRNTRRYDPETNSWTQVGHMKYGRWYPSGLTLSDGKVFVASGVTKLIKNTQASNVRRTETYDPATAAWTENMTGMASENTLPLYPRFHLMPNGKIFYAGNGQSWTPLGQAADEALWSLQQFFNPMTKQWEIVGPARSGVRSGAIDVLLPLRPPYTQASYMIAGGVLGPTPGAYVAIGLTEEYTVTDKGAVSYRRTGDLVNRRWFSQGVLLPDGQVLAINGGDVDEVIVPGTEAPIKQAEIYNPQTGTWTAMATAERGRTYHNSAILLADGRVLTGGHSPIATSYGHHRDLRPGGNNDKDPSLEIFSPPYLFRGARPAITRAPAGIEWGKDFAVTVSSPSDIESVTLVRLMATTHVVDNDQRALFLDFKQNGSTLQVSAPPSGTIAPPGNYYLFVNRKTKQGPVPSVAAIVNVDGKALGGLAPVPMLDSTAAVAGVGADATEDTTLRAPGPFCAGCEEEQQESMQQTSVQPAPVADAAGAATSAAADTAAAQTAAVRGAAGEAAASAASERVAVTAAGGDVSGVLAPPVLTATPAQQRRASPGAGGWALVAVVAATWYGRRKLLAARRP